MRSNRKKNTKKSKLIKKLKDDFFNLKKHYEQKITQLHIQLLDKEYYLSSILDFMNGYYHSPELFTQVSKTCALKMLSSLKIIKNSFYQKVTRKNPPKRSKTHQKNITNRKLRSFIFQLFE